MVIGRRKADYDFLHDVLNGIHTEYFGRFAAFLKSQQAPAFKPQSDKLIRFCAELNRLKPLADEIKVIADKAEKLISKAGLN